MCWHLRAPRFPRLEAAHLPREPQEGTRASVAASSEEPGRFLSSLLQDRGPKLSLLAVGLGHHQPESLWWAFSVQQSHGVARWL